MAIQAERMSLERERIKLHKERLAWRQDRLRQSNEAVEEAWSRAMVDEDVGSWETLSDEFNQSIDEWDASKNEAGKVRAVDAEDGNAKARHQIEDDESDVVEMLVRAVVEDAAFQQRVRALIDEARSRSVPTPKVYFPLETLHC